jgi:hypothetical protein
MTEMKRPGRGLDHRGRGNVKHSARRLALARQDTSQCDELVRVPQPTFLLRSRPLRGVDGIRNLRRALKILLRQCGLKAPSVEIEDAKQDGGQDGRRATKT